MDDFPNPAGENIANVLSFEESFPQISSPDDENIANVLSFEAPFPQISSQDDRNVPAAFKNIQRSYLSPEFRSTSVLKKTHK